MKQVTLKSGRKGWQGFLRENYESIAEFQNTSEAYDLHGRLGYTTPAQAWDANPIVQGSTNPTDFAKVQLTERQRGKAWADLECLSLDIYQTICRDGPKQSVLNRLQKKLARVHELTQLLKQ
jgi:hypothetical protein